MGFSKKNQLVEGIESEGKKKWLIAGISLEAPLRSITTKSKSRDENDSRSTTPTAKEARIPEKLPCPPAPRKRRPSPTPTCHYNGAREFFTPPDLETVFIRHIERAN
ncbi:cyclin-dependent protein kinase inhibitor SMR6 [Impatiens glandulifera]|uniref:cyclin-dependent protein kinase inhibitor SMR6 n=1 Tax=Impatiens glandulifera TaxID=253017 RepID=UPI001FB09F5A|nr:cyclin-dependent protein kinase inhibitor SMR6 [Impatiens glandulifera]